MANLKQRRKKFISYGDPLVADVTDLKRAANTRYAADSIKAGKIKELGDSVKEGVDIYSDYTKAKDYDKAKKEAKPDGYDDFSNSIDNEMARQSPGRMLKNGAERKYLNELKAESYNEKYGTNYSQAEIQGFVNYANKNKVFKNPREYAKSYLQKLVQAPNRILYNKKEKTLVNEKLSDFFKKNTGRNLTDFYSAEEIKIMDSKYLVKEAGTYLGNEVLTYKGRGSDGISIGEANKLAENLRGSVGDAGVAAVKSVIKNAYIRRIQDQNVEEEYLDKKLEVKFLNSDKKAREVRSKLPVEAATTPGGIRRTGKALADRNETDAVALFKDGLSSEDAIRDFVRNTKGKIPRHMLNDRKTKLMEIFSDEVTKTLFYSAAKEDQTTPLGYKRPKFTKTLSGDRLAEALYHAYIKLPGAKDRNYLRREKFVKAQWGKYMAVPSDRYALVKDTDKKADLLIKAGVPLEDFADALMRGDTKKMEAMESKHRNNVFKKYDSRYDKDALAVKQAEDERVSEERKKNSLSGKFKSWWDGLTNKKEK